jgi:BTB/POZ domain
MSLASKSENHVDHNTIDDGCRRLDSDICTIRIGPEGVVLKAHYAVLSQSPILEAVLKYRDDNSKALHIELRNQNPAVFRRILQYLYTLRLPVADSDNHKRFERLCELYILACKFELDEMQNKIISSFSESEDWVVGPCFARAVLDVYSAGQARWPFRAFFMERMKKYIGKYGLSSKHDIRFALQDFVTEGGTFAVDVASVLMDLADGSKDTSIQGSLAKRLQHAEEQITELEYLNERLEAEKMALETLYAITEESRRADEEVAECKLKISESVVECLLQQLQNPEAASESRLYEITQLVEATKRELGILKKNEATKKDTLSLRKQAKDPASLEAHRPHAQQIGRQVVQERNTEIDGEGLVAIACNDKRAIFEDDLEFGSGDRITNIVS